MPVGIQTQAIVSSGSTVSSVFDLRNMYRAIMLVAPSSGAVLGAFNSCQVFLQTAIVSQDLSGGVAPVSADFVRVTDRVNSGNDWTWAPGLAGKAVDVTDVLRSAAFARVECSAVQPGNVAFNLVTKT